MKRWIVGLALTALIASIAPQAYAQDPATSTATATSTITATGTATSPAPETDLAEVTIAPDSIFYSLKLFVERLRTAITLDAAERAALLTQLATTRLAEAKLMMEAGKTDLAETALKESQQKFQQAQLLVAGAVAAGRQLDSLQAQLERNEAGFSLAMDQILSKAPLESRTQVAAAVTDVKVQLAATRDSVVPDPKLTAAAQHLITALQTQTAQAAQQASPLPPRVLLALEAISKESGLPLADVLALYQQRRALGDLALDLKVKLESVQDGARLTLKIDGDEMEMKLKEADGTKTEITMKNGEMKVKVEEKDEDEDDDEEKKDRKVKLEFKEKKGKQGCKEHPVFKEHPGKGKGRGRQCDDRDEDQEDD